MAMSDPRYPNAQRNLRICLTVLLLASCIGTIIMGAFVLVSAVSGNLADTMRGWVLFIGHIGSAIFLAALIGHSGGGRAQ